MTVHSSLMPPWHMRTHRHTAFAHWGEASKLKVDSPVSNLVLLNYSRVPSASSAFLSGTQGTPGPGSFQRHLMREIPGDFQSLVCSRCKHRHRRGHVFMLLPESKGMISLSFTFLGFCWGIYGPSLPLPVLIAQAIFWG